MTKISSANTGIRTTPHFCRHSVGPSHKSLMSLLSLTLFLSPAQLWLIRVLGYIICLNDLVFFQIIAQLLLNIRLNHVKWPLQAYLILLHFTLLCFTEATFFLQTEGKHTNQQKDCDLPYCNTSILSLCGDLEPNAQYHHFEYLTTLTFKNGSFMRYK